MKSVASRINQTKAYAVAQQLGLDSSNLKYIGEKMWAIVVQITPKLATEWLEYNTNNRKLKERNISTMIEDMTNNKWKFSHEGIAFGLDNELKDGQNRLTSVIRSNKTIRCLVFIGLDDEAKGVINQGTNRTPLDAAKFANISTTRLAISSSKFCEVGMLGNTKVVSNSKALELVQKHKVAFDFIQEQFAKNKKNKGIAVSAIYAALMRAYYKYNDDDNKLLRLVKFCSILNDGQYGKIETDVAAFRLRELAIKSNWGGSSFSKELYKFAEDALVNFFANNPVKKLKALQEEAFPFEYEQQSAVA